MTDLNRLLRRAAGIPTAEERAVFETRYSQRQPQEPPADDVTRYTRDEWERHRRGINPGRVTADEALNALVREYSVARRNRRPVDDVLHVPESDDD